MKQNLVFMLLVAVFCSTVFYNIGKNECPVNSVVDTQPFENDNDTTIYTIMFDPETGYTVRGTHVEVEYHEEWVRINNEVYFGGWKGNVFDFEDSLTGGLITVNNQSLTLLFGKVDKPENKLIYVK